MKSRKQKNHKRKTFRKFRKSGKKNKTRVKRHMMIRKGGEGSVKNYYDTNVNSSFADPNQKEEEDSNIKKKFNFSGSLNDFRKNVNATIDYAKRRATNSKKVESLIEAIENDESKEIITKLIYDATNLNKTSYSKKEDYLVIAKNLNKTSYPKKEDYSVTPLVAAIFANNYYIVKLLINKGANVNDEYVYRKDFPESDRSTPLVAAVINSNLEKEKGEENYRVSCNIVKLLIDSGAEVTAPDHYSHTKEYGMNPIEIAIRGNNIEIIDLFLNAGVKINNNVWPHDDTPLDLAIYENKPDIVNFLIHKGANINQKRGRRRPPLHIAVDGNSLDIVNLLIENGADIDQKGWYDNTPLHSAIGNVFQYKNPDIVNLLIDKGADINQKNSRGETPLLRAKKYMLDEDSRNDRLDSIFRAIVEKLERKEAENKKNLNETPITGA